MLVKYKKIIMYGLFSVLALVVDAAIFFILTSKTDLNIVLSNTIAMCVGFIVQFTLSSRKVFGVKIDLNSLMVYVLTTLLGFAIANITLKISYDILFQGNKIVAKGLAVIVPFFIMYFLRKIIFSSKKFSNNHNNESAN